MILFNCDYSEGAHPRIIERLAQTNFEQTPGYEEDAHCRRAADLIREKCGNDDLAVHFLVGGTQTNFTVISAALRPHQSALGVATAHINVHETGAIEATGHKVTVLPGAQGKISAQAIREFIDAYWRDDTHEHIAQPKLVYISEPTELGTLYSRAELREISEVCREKNLLLYIDGARLGYGLAALGNDVDLPFLAEICDAFYIGGTKVGALFGEAVVIVNPALKEDFRCIMKQRGALLAKGRLLGLQFETLFENVPEPASHGENDLYSEISAHAIRMAEILTKAFRDAGIKMFIDSPTNQIFPILPDALSEKLAEKYGFAHWQRMDEQNCAFRFCTSWATKEEDVLALAADIAAFAPALSRH